MQVNRAWYYERQHSIVEPSKRAEEVALRERLEQIILDFPGYGYRRVTHAFLVNGRTPDAPDVIWVADLTYIRLRSEFVYLATILDAYSRRCIGWNLSTRIDTNLALGALEEALATREVKAGLIHHSDRGVQYASYAYTERLVSLGIQISMSAKGNAYDNAKAESFFKTLKQEEVYLKEYHTFEEASANLGQFIDDVYNTKRLHSSLGYVPPIEFEMAYYQDVRC